MSFTSRIRHTWTRLRISTKSTSSSLFTRSYTSTSTSTSTSSQHWRTLLISGASLTGLACYFHSSIHCQGSDNFTTASPDGSPPPLSPPTPPPSIFEAAQASRASLDGMSTSDEKGIAFDKLCKPSTGRPLIVLVACGSFSPITNLHLLLFEQAKNRLMWDTNEFDVVGGILSPVHDAYGKTSLIPANHRLEMCKRALSTSEWISMSSWETLQSAWTPTAEVLCKYQAAINNSELYEQPVRVKLLCGADLLESVLVPGLWSKPDLDLILGTFGVACLERTGKNCAQLIADNPILAQYAHNIHIIPQTITNDISSTSVRYCIQRNLSVKYLIPDNVADYIYENALYGHNPHRQKQAHVLPAQSLKRTCGCTCNTCGCSTKSA